MSTSLPAVQALKLGRVRFSALYLVLSEDVLHFDLSAKPAPLLSFLTLSLLLFAISFLRLALGPTSNIWEGAYWASGGAFLLPSCFGGLLLRRTSISTSELKHRLPDHKLSSQHMVPLHTSSLKPRPAKEPLGPGVALPQGSLL